MQVNAVSSNSSSTATDPTAASSPSVSTTGTKTLGVNDFLKLLAVQMNAQDPLNPQKDTDFIAQMSSFTSLEQMKDLSTAMTAFTADSKATNAQNYLGKSVTLLDPNQGSITGTVTGINLQDGTPKVTVNGKSYDPIYITSIQAATATAAASTATSGSTSNP